MTKRNLSDLIREEAHKAPQEKEMDSANEGATAEEPPRARAKRTTKAQLEEMVAELTETLAAANQQADTLQKQVNALEKTLQEQKIWGQTLQQQLQEASSVQEKLNEQKLVNQNLQQELQQTRARNSELEKQEQLVHKLRAEVTELQQQRKKNQEELQQMRTRDAELEHQQAQAALPQQTPSQEPEPPVKLSRVVYGLRHRPLGRSNSQSLSDQDLGWFD
ncbi:MAG: hypothetical protein ACFB4I_18045 [Cyanophyceae cyanobacterium]